MHMRDHNMNKFTPPHIKCEFCGDLLKVYTVLRSDNNTFFYVCEYHDHVNSSNLHMSYKYQLAHVQPHLFRPCVDEMDFHFHYNNIKIRCVGNIVMNDIQERIYIRNTNDSTIKNIYRMYDGVLLRDYFENGMWVPACKNVTDVWVWVK